MLHGRNEIYILFPDSDFVLDVDAEGRLVEDVNQREFLVVEHVVQGIAELDVTEGFNMIPVLFPVLELRVTIIAIDDQMVGIVVWVLVRIDAELVAGFHRVSRQKFIFDI